MLVLSFDPGYTNLGIALVDTKAQEVLHSETVRAGGSGAPQAFAKVTRRALDNILAAYPKPDIVSTEAPPFGGRGGINPKVACLVWCVMGGVFDWAAQQKIPVRTIPPLRLKQYGAQVTGIPYTTQKKSRRERKFGVRKAVEALVPGYKENTDHETDAILVAFACSPDVSSPA